MVSVNWQSILKAKPSWFDKKSIGDFTDDEKKDFARIRDSFNKDSNVKSTEEEKEYFEEWTDKNIDLDPVLSRYGMGTPEEREERRKIAEDEARRKRREEALARVKRTKEPEILEELLEEKPEDYSKKRKGYITLKESIINNIEDLGPTDKPRYFKLDDSGNLLFMSKNLDYSGYKRERRDTEKPLPEGLDYYIVPERLKNVNIYHLASLDNNFKNTIEEIGKQKFGPALYNMMLGTKKVVDESEYSELIRNVFNDDKYLKYNYKGFFKGLKLLDKAYRLYKQNIPKEEWKPVELQTIANQIKANKIANMLPILKILEKHIANNPNYKIKGSDRQVKTFREFYNELRRFKKIYSESFDRVLDDLTGKKGFNLGEQWDKAYKLKNKRIVEGYSKLNLSKREQDIALTLHKEIERAIKKNLDLTKEEVEKIINDNIRDLEDEIPSQDFIKILKGQLNKLIDALKNVEGIDNLRKLVDSIGTSSKTIFIPFRTQPLKKALNPKLASLPEEPIKRLKKTLQAAEPSEYFGQDYTRLGELIDLLQEMDFTKGDTELNEKIKSISEQNIDMVATAARLRKTYETLYLQVRKIVYPKASEGSLREEEEV